MIQCYCYISSDIKIAVGDCKQTRDVEIASPPFRGLAMT